MKINSIKLVNFGIYKGVNKYSFDVDSKRNIIVVNGNNGSGKTTLLEAIKISLYGPYYLGYQTYNENYYTYIENKLNAYALDSLDTEFELEISISLWEKGQQNEYTINRRWNYSKLNLRELNSVYRNGEIISNQEKENFFMSLQTHLPLNLFNVFFFDGEQLDRLFLVDGNKGKLEEFNNIFSTLFNIDLFNHLKTDIRKYLKQKNVYSNLSVQEKEYTALQEKYDCLLIEINEIKENIIAQDILKRNLKLDLENTESHFMSIGGLSRELSIEINSTINKLEEDKKQLEFNNKSLLNELYPFVILNDELEEMLKLIDEERLEQEFATLRNKLNEPELIGYLNLALENELVDTPKIINTIVDYFNTPSKQNFRFDISQKDYYFIKSIQEEANQTTPKMVSDSFSAIEEINQEIYSYKQQLEKTYTMEVEEALSKIKNLQSSITAIDESINSKTNDLKQLETKLLEIEIAMANLRKEILLTKKDENIFTIIDKIEQVIETYISETRKQKFLDLEKYSTEMFQKLIRKEDFIKGIKINNEKGEISIINSLGKEMPVSNLSAGERQIYVLSLLWGVLKISDKKIPLVFDTLLGRLDKSHKKNILQNFLHTIGDQVIILATDSELNDESIDHLKPYIKSSYSIDFNSDNKDVSIKYEQLVINYGL